MPFSRNTRSWTPRSPPSRPRCSARRGAAAAAPPGSPSSPATAGSPSAACAARNGLPGGATTGAARRGGLMDLDDPCFLPAYELLARYRARELSPVEVTRAALERIERLDPLVNAFVTVTPELALDQARRAEAAWLAGEAAAPLAGVPASIKDLFPTKGIRTTRGSVRWRDWVPDFDAPSVGRMRAAGVVLLGKTNTPEAGWKGSTSNRVAGITRNPWDLGRTPGGSSGGAAVAVATGMGSLGLGSDGGGSVRLPAAFTGVYGLKPTHALVPGSGTGPFEHLGHVGPIARTVRDAALLLTVLAGPDERDRLSYDTP